MLLKALATALLLQRTSRVRWAEEVDSIGKRLDHGRDLPWEGWKRDGSRGARRRRESERCIAGPGSIR